ncbi:hypothetical protein [Limnobacter sp.]|uniref:hypothetical protein n=1 Tax=Limnobacter sp. TaxID=2003368 RepID=UPI00391CB188
MKVSLSPFSGEERIIYCCIVAYFFLNSKSLDDFADLCTGFDCIENTLDEQTRIAIRNLRQANTHIKTRRQAKARVQAYNDAIESKKIDHRPYFLIKQDLSFEPNWDDVIPDQVSQALNMLSQPLAVETKSSIEYADPTQPAQIDTDRIDAYKARVSPIPFVAKPAPTFPTTGKPRILGDILWNDLLSIADRFDSVDVKVGRQRPSERSWRRRFEDEDGKPTAILLERTATGSKPATHLQIKGIKHLIGLPGAGKTSLLYLLAGYLVENKFKAFFAFSSIEVASNFAETLLQYEVDIGLLYGQGLSTRNGHLSRFSSAMASRSHGLGEPKLTAKLYPSTCVLEAYCSDENLDFPHEKPPCGQIIQETPLKTNPKKIKSSNHVCALAGVCGRQRPDRTLIETSLWAGHIQSLFRKVPSIYSLEEVTFFEYLTERFDLLLVDECDQAQESLDVQGTPVITLYGEETSLDRAMIDRLHRKAAGGENQFFKQKIVQESFSRSQGFQRAVERLPMVISGTEISQEFRDRNANRLHTVQTLLSEIYAPQETFKTEKEAFEHTEKLKAVETLWDVAFKRVAFDDPFVSLEEVDPRKKGKHFQVEVNDQEQSAIDFATKALKMPRKEVNELHQVALRIFGMWVQNKQGQCGQLMVDWLKAFKPIPITMPSLRLSEYSLFLLAVTDLIAQHFQVDTYMAAMVHSGLMPEEALPKELRKDVKAILPDTLAGFLRGVRFTSTEKGDLTVSMVDFQGTPRLLAQRMQRESQHNSGAMSVLLTSATSMLEPSPSFHVRFGPDYVLSRPNSGQGWNESKYYFFPLKHPQTGRKLRFSGAPMDKKSSILCLMIDELLKNDDFSHVATFIKNNDVQDGQTRKAGFVVNSYEQCEIIFEHIRTNHPKWKEKTRYLKRSDIYKKEDNYAITSAEVERLGSDPDWEILIFPMSAIGRGVNIVFGYGSRQGQAMLGSLAFLTRPHPRSDSLQLIQGIIARRTQEFNESKFSSTADALQGYADARQAAVKEVRGLLRIPLISSKLGEYNEPFVANQMVMTLQTIGRAMRGDRPAFVYFVDSAWAPLSASGKQDSAKTSMLVMMNQVLEKCLASTDPFTRECYEHLYLPFKDPMQRISGLVSSDNVDADFEEE